MWLVIGLVFYFGYGRSHSRLEMLARWSAEGSRQVSSMIGVA